jgi:hypothetical protein
MGEVWCFFILTSLVGNFLNRVFLKQVSLHYMALNGGSGHGLLENNIHAITRRLSTTSTYSLRRVSFWIKIQGRTSRDANHSDMTLVQTVSIMQFQQSYW